MSQYLFTPPAVTAVPIVGSDRLFPVHRVYCVGRNYAAHAREMGFDPDREPPFSSVNRRMQWYRWLRVKV